MRDDVVALYVMPDGPYPKLVREWYDEKRDARSYAGRLPVVAHPPCQLWTNFAELNYRRYAKESLRPGNDHGMFAHALKCVRDFGGVLEHPAFSKAWARFGLVTPRPGVWRQADINEWVCEVWQSAYGHKARKRTWLLFVGGNPPIDPDWSRATGTHQCGWFDRIKPTVSKKEASLTPPRFAEYLVSLAALAAPI